MKRITQLAIVSSALLSVPVLAQQSGDDRSFEGAARDAWLLGKVEMAFTLNEHLNPFAIDTDVESGIVTLRGTVESDIDRDLAGEIAEGVEGVASVNNELIVDTETTTGANDEHTAQIEQADSNWFTDATLTASVKSRLLANGNVDALAIDVDTAGSVVTLSGRVSSEEEKDLAGQVAENTSDVDEVRNMLVVDQAN